MNGLPFLLSSSFFLPLTSQITSHSLRPSPPYPPSILNPGEAALKTKEKRHLSLFLLPFPRHQGGGKEPRMDLRSEQEGGRNRARGERGISYQKSRRERVDEAPRSGK